MINKKFYTVTFSLFLLCGFSTVTFAQSTSTVNEVKYDHTQEKVVRLNTVAMLFKPEGSGSKPLSRISILSEVMSELEAEGYTLPVDGAKTDGSALTIVGKERALSGEVLSDALAKHGHSNILLNTFSETLIGTPLPFTLETQPKGIQRGLQLNSLIKANFYTNKNMIVDYSMHVTLDDFNSSITSRLLVSPTTAILEVHNISQGILLILTSFR